MSTTTAARTGLQIPLHTDGRPGADFSPGPRRAPPAGVDLPGEHDARDDTTTRRQGDTTTWRHGDTLTR